MLKYVEYTRHGMGEPLMTVNIYKKVEDGKIISTFKILVFANASITIFETDRLEGGQVIEYTTEKIESVLNIIKKYYDEKTDDITVIGEEKLVDQLLDKLEG